MREDYKIKSFLTFAVFIILAFAVSYIAVHQYSLLPGGYEIKEAQEDYLHIQVNNWYGGVDEVITFTPNAGEKWRLVELEQQINNQQGLYMLLYAALLISLYTFKLKRMEGLKKRAALIQSGIVISILGIIIPLFQLINRIQQLLGII